MGSISLENVSKSFGDVHVIPGADLEIADGEFAPACAQACPADAIVFGRLDDPESKVSQLARQKRGIHLLEELGTLPRVTYLKEG